LHGFRAESGGGATVSGFAAVAVADIVDDQKTTA